MTIFRRVKTENFVVVDKSILKNEQLSWKAKGIMVYLLSMPDNWKFYVDELISHSKDGEKSFRSGLKELEKLGYLKRQPIREGGKIIEWETLVYETPVHSDNREVEKVNMPKVNVENATLLSNKELSNDELSTKDITGPELIKLFQAMYRDKYNVDYSVGNYGRDGKLLKDKVITPYPDLAEDIIRIGVQRYDELFKNGKFPRPTIAMFSWACNQIIAVIEQEKDLTNDIAAIDEDAIEQEELARLAKLMGGNGQWKL